MVAAEHSWPPPHVEGLLARAYHPPMSEPLFRSRPGGAEILPASQTEARPINDFIYLSEGLSNSYLVTTAEGGVIVNTGTGFESPVHKRLYDAVDPGPVRYIVFTQGHVDHVGGADMLSDETTEIIAHANNLEHQAYDGRLSDFRASRSAFAFAGAIQKMIEHEMAAPGAKIPAQSKPVPDITFETEYRFELGGVRFELLWTPGGETRDSLVIWLPDHEICFTGNLFSALFGHFPNLVTVRGDRYRDALEFLESLRQVRALEPKLLLVGHHGPVEGKERIQEELTRLEGAVEFVHDATVQGMNEGRDVFELMREIELPPSLEVGQGYGKVSWSVRAIWEYYAGWFHHRSTTELYPASPNAIAGDLVELAGGARALGERALDYVGLGKPLEALQLAEIALTAEPREKTALEAALKAHRMLAAHSENFWESAWLDRQIESLERRLAAERTGA